MFVIATSWVQVVSCFWLQFPQPSSPEKMLVLVFYVLVAVASISLNGLVVLLWLRSLKSQQIFLLNVNMKIFQLTWKSLDNFYY